MEIGRCSVWVIFESSPGHERHARRFGGIAGRAFAQRASVGSGVGMAADAVYVPPLRRLVPTGPGDVR